MITTTMTQPAVTKKTESLGKKLYRWISIKQELSERETIILSILKSLLEMEDTEKIFSPEGQAYYIINENKKSFVRIISNMVSITTESDMVTETVSLNAIKEIEKLIRDRVKADIEKLKAIWLEKESNILRKVEATIGNENEVISEVGEE